MFRVTQEIDFCYGHRLLDYSGKCRHLHGHNARVLIVMEGAKLNRLGMLVDFSDIKAALRTWVDATLDHRMILRTDDPALPFLRELGEPVHVIPDNPTAENIARLIHDYAKSKDFPVVEVSLWETPRSCATYRSTQ